MYPPGTRWICSGQASARVIAPTASEGYMKLEAIGEVFGVKKKE